MSRQAHIDGLRAISVLCVVLFHFSFSVVSGGFVGVDIFFVISGFLITRKITQEIAATGGFRYGAFAAGRVRRLFPALAVTLILSSVAAFWVLPPEEFRSLGNQIIASILPVSNILFWLQSGYFDANVSTKMLLHTWSLGVEEQFYLIWPLFLVASSALMRPRLLPVAVAVAATASFALNVVFANVEIVGAWEQKSAMFYLMPFRIFEFAIGAAGVWLVRYVPASQWIRSLAAVVGLLMIGASAVLFNGRMTFPCFPALLPCIGALLVILAQPGGTVGWLLANPVSSWLGRISYSLYLVHWPIVVAFYLTFFKAPSVAEAAVMGVIMLLLASSMYEWIEKPFQRHAPAGGWALRSRLFFAGSASLAATLIALGLHVAASDGWAWRMPAAMTAQQIAKGKIDRWALLPQACWVQYWETSPACHKDRRLQVLLFGDSHEPDGYNSLHAIYGQSPDVNLIVFGSTNTCELEFSDSAVRSPTKGLLCDERYDRMMSDEFISGIDIIAVSSLNPFNARSKDTWETVKRLKAKNKNMKIMVFGGYLNLSADCSTLFNRFRTFDACRDPNFVVFSDFAERDRLHVPLAARELDFLYINEMRLLCSAGTLASCEVEGGGEPFAYDIHHRSLGFSRHIGDLIAARYAADLAALGFPGDAAVANDRSAVTR